MFKTNKRVMETQKLFELIDTFHLRANSSQNVTSYAFSATGTIFWWHKQSHETKSECYEISAEKDAIEFIQSLLGEPVSEDSQRLPCWIVEKDVDDKGNPINVESTIKIKRKEIFSNYTNIPVSVTTLRGTLDLYEHLKKNGVEGLGIIQQGYQPSMGHFGFSVDMFVTTDKLSGNGTEKYLHVSVVKNRLFTSSNMEELEHFKSMKYIKGEPYKEILEVFLKYQNQK